MKKLFIICLAFLIAFPLSGSVLATNPRQYFDTSVQILIPEFFESLFSSAEVDEIGYDYSMLINDTHDAASIKLAFDLYINGHVYYGSADGEVDAYDGETFFLWEGMLKGNLDIDGVDHPILVGFAKEDSIDAVQLSITIKSFPSHNNQFTILIAGENVITDEMIDIFHSTTPQDDIANVNGSISVEDISPDGVMPCGFGGDLGNWEDDEPVNHGGYVLEVYKPSYLDNSCTYKSVAMTAYFNSSRNTVALLLDSYTNNVSEYTKGGANITVTTSIASVGYTLTCNESTDSSYSYIAGIEKFAFNDEDVGVPNVYIISLFEDILSLFGVPSSTIGSVLSSSKGEVNIAGFTNERSVNIEFAIGSRPQLERLNNGLPIVFQLAKGTGLYTGNSSYTAKVDISYHVLTTIFSNGQPVNISTYTDASAESVFTVTLQ